MKPAPRTPTLTILYHPVLRRMGERVFLRELLQPGLDAKVSRNAPKFTPPRQDRGTPLDEPHLSRKPFFLRRAVNGELVIDRGQSRARLAVDGEVVTDERTISPEELRRGVILELADHIALLLHEHAPVDEQEPGDLGLIGDSNAMIAVRESIRLIAARDDIPVLIRGETGSGKELVAEAIHAQSPRGEHEWLSVNLGAIPATVAAAELFGANKGAFTDAKQQKGYFRAANGSTLFLDEIGEAKDDVQVMLLRVLEKKCVQPLGAQRDEEVDVRVIAATDADLERRIAQGMFRGPLLHRLARYEIHVPPLRERRDDIVRLMLHFLGLELSDRKKADRLEQRDPAPWLPMELVVRLAGCRWPGNVRQLHNAVSTLIIDNDGRAVATMSPQLERLLADPDPAPAGAGATADGNGARAPGNQATRFWPQPSDYSDEYLRDTLRARGWEIAAAATALGMSRTTLYKRIEASPILCTIKDYTDDEIRDCHAACKGDIDAMVERLQVSRSALMPRLKKLGLV